MDLRDNLQSKLDNVNEKIGADEEVRGSLLKELKAITGQLESVDAKLSTLKGTHSQFAKTITEIDFALNKITDTAITIEEKLAKLARLNG